MLLVIGGHAGTRRGDLNDTQSCQIHTGMGLVAVYAHTGIPSS